MKPHFLIPTVLSGGQSYIQKVLGIETANLISYWPMNEASGTNADNAEGTAARDGTFARDVSTMGTGTGIGDGNTAPDFDGTQDYNNVYSTSLRDAFNGSEGTLFIWSKVSASGIWTDSTRRDCIQLQVDGNNFLQIRRSTINNAFDFRYNAGGSHKVVTKSSLSETGWMTFAITWSATSDQMKAYYNGVQEGSTQTSLGSWAGNLSSSSCVIGASNTTPVNLWSGFLAHCALWTTPLSVTQLANLSSP